MQKRQLDRRNLIRHIIEMTGISSPKEIHAILRDEHNTKVDYQTVYQDLVYIREHASRWLSDTLKTSWNVKLFAVYKSLNEDIKQLRDLKNELATNRDIPIEKKLGKVAFADRIITEQCQFLSEFMGSKALYSKLREYLERGDIDKLKESITNYEEPEKNEAQ